jgi:hypothetical protein
MRRIVYLVICSSVVLAMLGCSKKPVDIETYVEEAIAKKNPSNLDECMAECQRMGREFSGDPKKYGEIGGTCFVKCLNRFGPK